MDVLLKHAYVEPWEIQVRFQHRKNCGTKRDVLIRLYGEVQNTLLCNTYVLTEYLYEQSRNIYTSPLA